MNELRCNCRSDQRSLVLLSSTLASDYPELLDLGPKADWQLYPDLGAIRVELGSDHRMAGVADLVNFLRGVLTPPRLEGLRAAWVVPHKRLEDQFANLIHAGPLLGMVSADSSPLLDMFKAQRLETWFQPILHAKSGEVWGHECLMRGRDAEGKLIYPDQIISWARQENLLFMMDRICRETHLNNAAKYLAGSDTQILINFLPTAIYTPEFCLKTTVAAATKGGLAPERIIFEVVETEKLTDIEHLRSVLKYYRSMGFRVALDDLGSGYSGLALLGDLDPDLIKIDRHLITQATRSPMHRSICQSLIDLGRDHDKLVLAEGIETVEEKELLGGMGVDLFQGYLFGRPSPVPAGSALAGGGQAVAGVGTPSPEPQARKTGHMGAGRLSLI